MQPVPESLVEILTTQDGSDYRLYKVISEIEDWYINVRRAVVTAQMQFNPVPAELAAALTELRSIEAVLDILNAQVIARENYLDSLKTAFRRHASNHPSATAADLAEYGARDMDSDDFTPTPTQLAHAPVINVEMALRLISRLQSATGVLNAAT